MVFEEDVYAMSSFSSLIQQEEREEVILLDLYTACLIGDYDAVRDFVAAKENLNQQNFAGWTALMYAAYVGRDTILNMLLENGAEKEITTTKNGMTALMLASYSATESIMYFLLQAGSNINARDMNGLTSLYHAVKQGHTSAVKLLATHGADLNLGHLHKGSSPLMEAAESGNEVICEILLEHGADAGIQDQQGRTARSIAMHGGYANVVELIDKTGQELQSASLREEPSLGAVAVFHPGTQESSISEGPQAVRNLVMQQANGNQQAPVAALCPDFNRLLTKPPKDNYNAPYSHEMQMSETPSIHNPGKGANTVHFSEERPLKKAGRMTSGEPPKQVFFQPQQQQQQLPDTLLELLEEFKLESHLAMFESQGIDTNTFLALNDNDLRELGVVKLGPRKKILIAINKIRHRMAFTNQSGVGMEHTEQLQAQVNELSMQLQQSYVYIKQLQTQLQKEQNYRTELNSYHDNEQNKMRQIIFFTNDIGKNCKEACSQVRKIKDYNSQVNLALQRLKAQDFQSIDNSLFESTSSIDCETGVVVNRLEMTCKQIERTLNVARGQPTPQTPST